MSGEFCSEDRCNLAFFMGLLWLATRLRNNIGKKRVTGWEIFLRIYLKKILKI